MIKIIWSDDIFSNPEDIQSSYENAYDNGFHLVAKQTWEETQKELEIAGETYDAIILDGRGQTQLDSKTEDKGHLTTAMSWISEQKGKGKIYPTIIYTGYYDDINDLYGSNKDVKIVKKPNFQEVYYFIKERVKDLPNQKIKERYEQSWGIFYNQILDSQKENLLLSLIKKVELETFEKSDFNSIRDIFETLLKRYNEIDPVNLLPNEVINGSGNVNLEWSLRILKGLETEIKNDSIVIRTIPKNTNPPVNPKHHISYCFDFVKNISSALSHRYQEPFGETVQVACLNALLEILNWSNKFICNNYPNSL